MALNSSANSEFVAIKVFLYKYTPHFTFLDEDTKSAVLASIQKGNTSSKSTNDLNAAAITVFNTMASNANDDLAIVTNILNEPFIRDVSSGSVTLSDVFSDWNNIGALITKYKQIPAGGKYLFASKDIINNSSVEPSFEKLLGSHPIQDISEETIVSTVLPSLPFQAPLNSGIVSSYFIIPNHDMVQSVSTTPTTFTDFFILLSQSSLSTLSTTPVSYQAQLFTAWRNHATDLQTKLQALLHLKTSLATAPPATVSGGSSSSNKVEKPFKITKYKIDLNASEYFSKFDITQFVKSYTFNHSLYGNAYNWSLNLQDAVIPFSQLNPGTGSGTIRKIAKFKDQTGKIVASVTGPPCRKDGSAIPANDLVHLMAEYESEDTYPTTFDDEVNIIESAFLNRGIGKVPYQSTFQVATQQQNIETAHSSSISASVPSSQPSGIRLGDLVQKYNFISVFVYKSPVSPIKAKKSLFPKGVPKVDNPKSQSDYEVFDESNEVHLMLAGFRNEFNGFVTDKSWEINTGQVDRVTVNGHGALRLFSDTLVMYDPALVANGFYGAAELATTLATQQKFTVFKNLFSGQDPIQILTQLLDLIYRVDFVVKKTPDGVDFPLTELHGFFNFEKMERLHMSPAIPSLTNPGDTSRNKLLAGNLFTIPPFLLACVMSLRNYNYNLNNTGAGISTVALLGVSSSSEKFLNTIDSPDIQFSEMGTNLINSSKFTDEFGGPCAQISFVSDQFKPYFQMLKDGFSNFISTLKSPNQIMDEVIKFSLLEFYERPNGRIVLRTPQYNQFSRTTSLGVWDFSGNVLDSKNFNMISRQYSEDGTQLFTQKRGSYAVNLVGDIFNGLFQPAYGNGKLMMQYGFREDTVEPNPILQPIVQKQQQAQHKIDLNNLVHKYVRFLLEFDNAGRRVGIVSLDGDPALEIGKLFFDSTNNKIGYIIDVKKTLTVGGTYTASLNLKFVRDAKTLDGFRNLPTLEELITSLGTMVIGEPATSIMEFNHAPTPPITPATLQQITTQLIQGLSTPPLGGIGNIFQ